MYRHHSYAKWGHKDTKGTETSSVPREKITHRPPFSQIYKWCREIPEEVHCCNVTLHGYCDDIGNSKSEGPFQFL